MKKNLPASFIFILFASVTLAQQRPLQSLYMFDPLLVNPAFAGSQVQLSATSIYRNQWVNLDGAPKTFTMTAHSGFRKYRVGEVSFYRMIKLASTTMLAFMECTLIKFLLPKKECFLWGFKEALTI